MKKKATTKKKAKARAGNGRGNGRLSDAEETRGLYAFLIEDGDVAKARAHVPELDAKTLGRYAATEFWQMMLIRQRHALATRAADEALAQKELELKMLRQVRTKLYYKLMGKLKDGSTTEYEIAPLQPKQFEASGKLLLDVLASLRDVTTADMGDVDDRDIRSFAGFVRDAVKNGGEVTVRGTNGDKKMPRAEDDDDPLGIRGAFGTGLEDVEDRG
jgi:hypothetical protein